MAIAEGPTQPAPRGGRRGRCRPCAARRRRCPGRRRRRRLAGLGACGMPSAAPAASRLSRCRTRADPPRAFARCFVVGDSTGVGVGAGSAENSLAGLLASEFPEVQVVNVAATGARLIDAIGRAEDIAAQGERFDLVLLLVGGNDIFRHTRAKTMREQSRTLLACLGAGLARRTVWLGSANIGAAPVFAPPMSWWFAWRTSARRGDVRARGPGRRRAVHRLRQRGLRLGLRHRHGRLGLAPPTAFIPTRPATGTASTC
ncbi:MAG: GDSL-type esterase/lipase family protein [Comamonadaceae bacterium]|nr:GDSL-type esterase/lipase family protein [Comamonadaceae bacterium]